VGRHRRVRALVAVSVAQTAAGRSPFDLGAAAAALTLAGAALLAAARTVRRLEYVAAPRLP
jgi:hypothetical protein